MPSKREYVFEFLGGPKNGRRNSENSSDSELRSHWYSMGSTVGARVDDYVVAGFYETNEPGAVIHTVYLNYAPLQSRHETNQSS